MSNLIDRLRKGAEGYGFQHSILAEAAAALERAEREREELRNKLDALADAASMVCYCPSAGGYYEGASVEDTFEKLQEALDDHYGFQLDIDVNEWYTEEEMRKRRLRGGDDE